MKSAAKATNSLERATMETTAETDNLGSALVALICDTMVVWRPVMGSMLAGVEFDHEEESSFSAN